MTCVGCHKVFYCGRSCQKANWKHHRLEHHALPVYSPAPEVFNVQLALLSGAISIVEDCSELMTIAQLKDKVAKKMGIPAHEQVLLLGLNTLEDNNSLRNAGVDQTTCLSLVRDDDRPPALVHSSDSDVPPGSGDDAPSSSGDDAPSSSDDGVTMMGIVIALMQSSKVAEVV